MMHKPPSEPAQATRKLDPVELRIANLHRELEADPDPSARAAILYQIGSLYEHELVRVTEAMQAYEQATQACPTFEPAHVAQMRLAERSTCEHDVNRVCASMAATARAPGLSAAALIDRALHSDDWASLLREAIERSVAPAVPALLLEWLSECAGDRESLGHALRVQAEHASDPALKGALWVDVALHEMERGEVDAALDALERASDSEMIVWAARGLQRRLAKEHRRWDELIRADRSLACLLEAAVETEEGLDPLHLPVPAEERLGMAVTLWQEAAACCANELGMVEMAAGYLESALRLMPDDLQTRLSALRLAERLGDEGAIAQASKWFRDTAPEHPAFVALQVRRASSAAAGRRAVDWLSATAERHPDSAFVRAALDVALIRLEAHDELARRLRERAEASEGEHRQLLLWQAAQVRAATAGGADESELSGAACAADRWKVPILWDALGLAFKEKRADAVVAHCDELLGCRLPPQERSLVAFCKYDATANALGETAAADRLLHDFLEHEEHQGWAPHLARVRGALGDDPTLLAQAHEALAELSIGDTRTGHLCAAGEAHARGGDWAAAQRVIRQALRAAPDHPYALALFDGVLRESGETERVLAFATERERAQSSASVRELSLLLAGANAEREGHLDLAQDAYEQASSTSPHSASAALALADVARRRSDSKTRLRAYARLMESGLEDGVPELFALLRGDALGLDGATAAQASEAYGRALEHPIAAPSGAVGLLSMPRDVTNAEMRAAAEETLGDVLEQGAACGNGFAAAYGGLRASWSQEGTSTGDAWLQLAALTPTNALRAQTLLQGVRASRIAKGERALDDLLIRTQESLDLTQLGPETATLLEEALAPGDDPELRAAALDYKLERSGALGRGALAAAYARALVEADRGADAVALLSRAVEERPDDLAVWETLRGAARQAEQWPLVAQACERLAQFVEGSLQADLLEEAAVIRLDFMGQDQQAEDLFRSALEADPRRDVAFRRLHDLLAEKEDAEALEALVSARLAQGGPKDRPDLLYERARLLRGFSDRPGALEVLNELFTTDPDHAGALALAAEVHVSLEQWEEAVECLQRLASANISEEQRRVAHLGAADFLENRLDRKDQALAELRAIEALGLADADIWARIGALEEQAAKPEAAVDAYRQALRSEPSHSVAIAGAARLLDGADKDMAVARYEEGLWEHIEAGELNASSLGCLRDAALWRGHLERASAIADVARALGVDTAESAPWISRLSDLSLASLWDRETSPLLDEVLRRAGPSLSKPRARAKKAATNDPVYIELERLCERFGARLGSVGRSAELSVPVAYGGSDREIHWLVPNEARDGLDERSRFAAGRLAWAVPRGAGWLLEDAAPRTASKIAALLRAARCPVEVGEAMLPAVELKLRRAARRSVQEAVGHNAVGSATLLSFARSLHRSADRAGLLACGEIGVALDVVLRGTTSIASLRSSARGLDLARFCMDADSSLWRADARG
jgi:tetratricopeptide (TPR) repeat protein